MIDGTWNQIQNAQTFASTIASSCSSGTLLCVYTRVELLWGFMHASHEIAHRIHARTPQAGSKDTADLRARCPQYLHAGYA